MRRLLFHLDPELAHHATVETCRVLGRVPGLGGAMENRFAVREPQLRSEVAGLHLDNPLGLAAGWDKSGRAVRMLDRLGFGFLEIGSVSARPSKGNPRPRLFRLPADRAIVVNYGLPNDGARAVAKRLRCYAPRVPLGVNIVKTNDGPGAPTCSAEEVLDDYYESVRQLHPVASYVMLNLSCPNVGDEGGFFAGKQHLRRLLEQLRPLEIACPVFLKVAPDPAPEAIENLIAAAEPFEFVRGFCFNLPSGKPDRLATPHSVWQAMPGAVSGAPVESRINTCIGELYRRMPAARFAIVGAGGVFSAEDAYRKIRLGASLVQLYTALVYEGPGVVARINRGLAELLARDGLKHVAEAVGVDQR